ncbi:MAG: putative sulfate exporter family transporter [Aquisalinus sp.]|nr:putative sulfate exporter family transporter [Aquisalinus sp.]
MRYLNISLAWPDIKKLLPGFLAAFIIAVAAQCIAGHYGAPAMLFALLIGMAFHFLSEREKYTVGISFTSHRLLKAGVALLGARVTFEEIASLGIAPILIVPLLISAVILAGMVFARLTSQSNYFGVLTGGAVAVCGASAALAIASVMPRTDQVKHDTLFTVVAVTTLSTIAMVIYPVLFLALGFNDQQAGFLIGATIHDVAQVIGAGYAVSDETGHIATYVKLLRVCCLPFVLLAVVLMLRRKNTENAPAVFPWFAVVFAAILAVNSIGLLPEVIRNMMAVASEWLLVSAIAALGIKTSLKTLTALGPIYLGVIIAETVFLFAIAVLAVNFVS